MTYEKYLKQIIRTMAKASERTRFFVEQSFGLEGDIFEQINTIQRSLNIAHRHSEVMASYDQFLNVPKSFVEQSKATSAEKIFRQYYKEKNSK